MANETDMQTIEINGVKMEVDMRTARKVDNFRIGSRVKLLKKEEYASRHDVLHGVIVAFDMFESLPTITVCYIENGYQPDMKFAHINADTKNLEIVADTDEALPADKDSVLGTLDRGIAKAQHDLESAVAKRDYFLKQFNQMFEMPKENESDSANA